MVTLVKVSDLTPNQSRTYGYYAQNNSRMRAIFLALKYGS